MLFFSFSYSVARPSVLVFNVNIPYAPCSVQQPKIHSFHCYRRLFSSFLIGLIYSFAMAVIGTYFVCVNIGRSGHIEASVCKRGCKVAVIVMCVSADSIKSAQHQSDALAPKSDTINSQ